MLRDRGSIKWTSLMLPEHVKELRKWHAEDAQPQRQMPDEEQLEQWNRLLIEAFSGRFPLFIVYWENGTRQAVSGRVRQFEPAEAVLKIIKSDGRPYTIALHTIEVLEKHNPLKD